MKGKNLIFEEKNISNFLILCFPPGTHYSRVPLKKFSLFGPAVWPAIAIQIYMSEELNYIEINIKTDILRLFTVYEKMQKLKKKCMLRKWSYEPFDR